jgi:hypothetical protein
MSLLTPKQALLDSVVNDNNPFREEITYTATGAAAKTINAVVMRETGSFKHRGVQAQTQPRPRYDCEIVISHDSNEGIEEVTPRKDTVTMEAPELRSTSHTFQVVAIIGKSRMGWHLGLQQ